MRRTPVEVSTINIDWLLRDRKHFIRFINAVSSKKSRIYQTRFMVTLVDAFWQDNFEKIIFYCFFPWVL